MSGAFKWSTVTFDPTSVTLDVTTGAVVLLAVAAARASAAAAEAACRMEAEKAAMMDALIDAKRDGTGSVREARSLIDQQSADVSNADLQQAMARLAEAEDAIDSARDQTEFHEAILAVERVRTEFDKAVRRKRLDDARHGHAGAIPALRAQFEALRDHAGELNASTYAACDEDGAAAVKTLLAAVGGALQTTNEKMIAAKLKELEAALNKHGDALLAERERVQRAAAIGEQAVAESKALISGLRADEIVMRWHTHAVNELENELALVAEFVMAKNTDRAAAAIVTARERASNIVCEANSAQLKADQRDYIAQCISKTLEEMGFVVGPPQAEHPEHPATATVIHAATASGKNIAVSVPVDGQVWYNVQGFPKSTEASSGGGEAAICDEAEDVINEMHEALNSEFQIRMSELMWDGKDPERRLRAVKSLPSTSGSDRSMTGGKR